LGFQTLRKEGKDCGWVIGQVGCVPDRARFDGDKEPVSSSEVA